MNMIPKFSPRVQSPETGVAHFLQCHAEALISAAALLGGRPAVARTARLIEDVAEARTLTRRLRRELKGLHRLLSLQCVGDIDSLEAACFAVIDPASPAVEEICLLCDELTERLEALPGSVERCPAGSGIRNAA